MISKARRIHQFSGSLILNSQLGDCSTISIQHLSPFLFKSSAQLLRGCTSTPRKRARLNPPPSRPTCTPLWGPWVMWWNRQEKGRMRPGLLCVCWEKCSNKQREDPFLQVLFYLKYLSSCHPGTVLRQKGSHPHPSSRYHSQPSRSGLSFTKLITAPSTSVQFCTSGSVLFLFHSDKADSFLFS